MKGSLADTQIKGKYMDEYNEVIIWGASQRGRLIYEALQVLGVRVTCFIDNNKRNDFCDLKIMNPQDVILNLDNDSIIIIASLRSSVTKEIKEEIINYGYKGSVMTSYDFYMNYERNALLFNKKEKYVIDYENKIKNWFDSFLDEVRFWRMQVADRKGDWHFSYRDKFKKKEFQCERLLKKIGGLNGSEIILDVGCGICSPHGKMWKGVPLNFVQVDPLAHFYNQINRRFMLEINDDECVETVKFGMFELLSSFFGEEYCDYLLIDNALDHCIDPVRALKECINVVKTGGFVSLSHHTNEAYRENFYGLHQWNICCNGNNELCIWNNNDYINVNKELGANVEIEVWNERGDVDHSPYGITVCNIKKIKSMDVSGDKWKWTGIVMDCMMDKMSDVSYSTNMIKIMY